MTKVFISLTLVLITFSLTKSAKPLTNGVNSNRKGGDVTTKTPTVEQSMEEDQGKMNDVDVMAIMSECNETFRIEMSYLEALNESGSFPDESDRTPKCYLRCCLMKTSIANEEGQLDPARAAAVLAGAHPMGGKPMDDIEDIAKACANNRQETCRCEMAYQFLKCIMEMQIKKTESSL